MKKLVLLTLLTTQLTGAVVAGVCARVVADRPRPSTQPLVQAPERIRSQDEPNSSEQLFSNDQIKVSSIFPNPVSAANSYASVKYEFHGGVRDAKIVLCNVLGNVLGEYRLVREAKQLNIATRELTPGVYFYTLVLESNKVATRKFIVRENF